MSRGFDRRIVRARALCCALLPAIIAGGCRRQPEPPRQVRDVQQRVEEGRERHQQLVAQVQALPMPQLIDRLRGDSRSGVEPFNSLAFREAVRRGSAAAPALAASITGTDRSFLLPLLALRSIERRPATPGDSVKAAILVGALQQSQTFNIWGLPHLYWEDAAKAIIEVGPAARPRLLALLDDTRPAPVWGSEEVAEYQRYRYRVCDYALALLLAIQGQGRAPALPVDPAARDSLKRSVLRPPPP